MSYDELRYKINVRYKEKSKHRNLNQNEIKVIKVLQKLPSGNNFLTIKTWRGQYSKVWRDQMNFSNHWQTKGFLQAILGSLVSCLWVCIEAWTKLAHGVRKPCRKQHRWWWWWFHHDQLQILLDERNTRWTFGTAAFYFDYYCRPDFGTWLFCNQHTDCERIIWNLSSREVSRTPKHSRRLWDPIQPKEPWLESECDWRTGSTSRPPWWPVPVRTETSCGLCVHQQKKTFLKLIYRTSEQRWRTLFYLK